MDSEPVSQSDSEKLNEWPPAEGRYAVGNKQSPVAVCTMSSVDIRLPMDRIAISGKCVTENLGVEKIVRNVVANPNIRYIIVAGRESMGHFVDNALESLVEKMEQGDLSLEDSLSHFERGVQLSRACQKALKEAVAAGEKIGIFAPGLGIAKNDGWESLEGPHYPKPHTWYAEVFMENGIIVEVR